VRAAGKAGITPGSKEEPTMNRGGVVRDFIAISSLFATLCGWYAVGSLLIS